MNYAQAIDYLGRYTNYERELRYPYDGWAMNLERVRVMFRELGNPQDSLTIVHVAGTKGKGSTAAMLESMARAQGYSTGLFSSPHLSDFRERILVSGQWVSEQMVAGLAGELVPAAEAVHAEPRLGAVTYFEILTALAAAAFARSGVELAILEAGLGGRFDATTACDPAVSVLAPVSLDHTDILGDTIEKIAIEKSFIIKPGRPAVVAPQPDEAGRVFSARCGEVGAPRVLVSERYRGKPISQDMDGLVADVSGARELPGLRLSLVGAHQLENALTALAAADLLADSGLPISDEAAREGLASVRWRGRFERIATNPDIILDGAHNASSAARLRDTLAAVCPGRRVVAILGLGGDKDVEGFCRELAPALSAVLVTRSKAMKAVDADRIRGALRLGLDGSGAGGGIEIADTAGVAEAMARARDMAGPDDVVLVTGSFYVISEVLAMDRDMPEAAS